MGVRIGSNYVTVTEGQHYLTCPWTVAELEASECPYCGMGRIYHDSGSKRELALVIDLKKRRKSLATSFG